MSNKNHCQDNNDDNLKNIHNGQNDAPAESKTTVDENTGENTVAEESAPDDLAAELDATKAALEKEKKEYLFLMAEFDNFRKRTIKEKSEIIKNASEKVLAGLLPIIDDFERGIEANLTADDADTIKQGMELIYNKLIKYIGQNGVKPIESTGAAFDPDLHEAIAMVPAPDDDSHGKVIDTPTKGYTINDKVLRHAKVVVAQ